MADAKLTALSAVASVGVDDLFYIVQSGVSMKCTAAQIVSFASVPSAANPTASVGLTAVNGSAGTFLRSDGAPALSQAIAPTWTGVHTWTPTIRTSGTAPYFTVNAPADTGLTASTEAIGVSFPGATRQHATGSLTTQREIVITPPTYSFVGASTLTTAITLDITGAPVAGTNATITNKIVARLSAATAAEVPLLINSPAYSTGAVQSYLQMCYLTNSTYPAFNFVVNTAVPTNELRCHASSTEYIFFGQQNASYNSPAGMGLTAFNRAGPILISNFASSQNNSVIVFHAAPTNTLGTRLLALKSDAENSGWAITASGCKLGWSSDNISSLTTAPDTYFTRAAAGVAIATSWLQDAGRTRLTAAVTNTTTTFANLTDLSITLIAGRKYTGRLVLFVNDATAADGLKIDFNGGAATMTSVEFGFSSALGATVDTRTSTALATAVNLTALADAKDVVIEIPFTCVVNAAGTLIPRQAKDSDAGGATLTLRAGSYFHLLDSVN